MTQMAVSITQPQEYVLENGYFWRVIQTCV
jgi:hypothetical protein